MNTRNQPAAIVTLPALPDVTIPEGVAVSESADGFVRSFKPDERFRGFAMNTLLANSGEKNISVLRAGTMELLVDRLQDAAPGAVVYAEDSVTFTTAHRRGHEAFTAIGKLLKINGPRRALVEFSA